MRFLYNNLALDATVTSFSENPDYTFTTALADTRLSRVGRTVDDDDQWIKFDLATASKVDYLGILAHNITSSATVILEGNASDSWGSPSYTQTITVTTTALDIVVQTTSQQTYRWWRLRIDDASNPDTYIEIGLVYLGEYTQPHSWQLGQAKTIKSNSTIQKSRSGQLYGDRQLIYKAAEFTLKDVNATEQAQIEAMFNVVDKVQPFILLFWEESLDVEPPLYCSLVSDLEWKGVTAIGGLCDITMKVEECF